MVSEHIIPLFNPVIIKEAMEQVDKSKHIVDPSIYNCVLRPMTENDFDKSFGDLLAELNPIGDLNAKKFKRQFNKMRDCMDVYFIVVIEDKTNGKVIAAGALLLEKKFYRATTTRGRIEMLIVQEKYRGRGFGKLIVHVLTCIGKYKGCYRVSLETQGQNMKFYLDKCFYIEENDIYMDMSYPVLAKEQKNPCLLVQQLTNTISHVSVSCQHC